MKWIGLAAPGVAALLIMAAVWRALHPPRPVGFVHPKPWTVRLAEWADTRIRSGWNPVTQRQAQILKITPLTLVAMTAALGAVGWVIGTTLIHSQLLAVVLAGVMGWKGPALMIGRRFKRRRAILDRDFPPMVLLLRIYLDLGVAVPQSFQRTRTALSRTGRAEIDRMLSGLGLGAHAEALRDWAQRTGLVSYRLLADTIAQGWDQGLTGEALTPLDTLIQSSREQGTRSLTDRLDGVGTLVPIIAAFGVMIVIFYAMFYGSLFG